MDGFGNINNLINADDIHGLSLASEQSSPRSPGTPLGFMEPTDACVAGAPAYTSEGTGTTVTVTRPRGASLGGGSVREQDARVHAAEYDLDPSTMTDSRGGSPFQPHGGLAASPPLAPSEPPSRLTNKMDFNTMLREQMAGMESALRAGGSGINWGGMRRSASAPSLTAEATAAMAANAAQDAQAAATGSGLSSFWAPPTAEYPSDMLRSAAAQSPVLAPQALSAPSTTTSLDIENSTSAGAPQGIASASGSVGMPHLALSPPPTAGPMGGAAQLAGGEAVPARTNSQGQSGLSATSRGEGKLVIGMVGLPARGKTYIARKLKRHLSWLGLSTEIYNVGNFRRTLMKGSKADHDFFSPTNEEGMRARRHFAKVALDSMLTELTEKGVDIGVFDATNSTKDRRQWLLSEVQAAGRRSGCNMRLVFVEAICTDERIIRSNIRETKLKSPDYRSMREEEAVADFLQRIAHYVQAYQPLDDDEGVGYIQLIDVGRKIIANQMTGFLNSRILYFLSNLSITPRPIWLTRHGESQYNVKGLIGGDSDLSEKGQLYAQELAEFIEEHYPAGTPLTVWTSTLRRTCSTAAPLVTKCGRTSIQWKALDEIDAGVCDGMTYEGIAAKMPEEYSARAADKFNYRYPQGESYQDIVHRLEPVIIELMRQKGPVLYVPCPPLHAPSVYTALYLQNHLPPSHTACAVCVPD